MKPYIQDIINNSIIILAAFYIGRKQERRSFFYLKSSLIFILICIIRYLYFNKIVGLFATNLRLFMIMCGFILLIFMFILEVMASLKLSFWSATFLVSVGYCLQHLSQRIYAYSTSFLSDDSLAIFYYLIYAGIIIIVGSIFYLLLKKLNIDYIDVKNKSVIAIGLFTIISTIVLNMLFIRYIGDGEDGLILAFNLTMVIMTLLLILYEMTILKSNNIERERDNIKEILIKDREQYIYEKSIIELLNIKIHDLKHISDNISNDEKENVSKEMSDAITTYDSIIRTSNPALDVVLTRSNFRCKEKNIYYTFMVDSDSLSFLSEIDTYSLFGNILDNAIEAVDKINEKDKRVIDIKISKKNCFVTIHEENYFTGEIKFLDGLPQTSKKNKELHGYGLKSIQSIVSKYKGSIDIKTQKDRFVLSIIFPVEQ